MDELADRIRRAIESLMENESLTSSLDDAAAEGLLAWGMDCAQRIVSSTAGLDDPEAEEVMYPRMRALRRLMRQVNKWAARQHGLDKAGEAFSLEQVIEQAAIIYGPDFVAPELNLRRSFLMRLAFSPQPMQMIADLRTLIENQHLWNRRSDDKNNTQVFTEKDDNAPSVAPKVDRW